MKMSLDISESHLGSSDEINRNIWEKLCDTPGISMTVAEISCFSYHKRISAGRLGSQFWGGSCVGLLGPFGPKGALGSQKHVEEVSEVSEKIWRFLKKICAASSFKSASCNHIVLNPATRWRSSTPNSCKTLLVSTWTKVLEVCRYKHLLSNLSWYV